MHMKINFGEEVCKRMKILLIHPNIIVIIITKKINSWVPYTFMQKSLYVDKGSFKQ